MSLRGEWEFTIPTSELRAKAAEKVEHHRSRLEHYTAERERLHAEFIESVRQSAEKATEAEQVEYAQNLENLMSHSHSSGMGLQPRTIQGDPEVKRDLDRAHQKVQEHGAKIGTYEMWVELLAREEQDTERTLQIDDAHFFGL